MGPLFLFRMAAMKRSVTVRKALLCRPAKRQALAAGLCAFLVVSLLGLALVVAGCGNDPLAAARKADRANDYKTAVSLYKQKLDQDPANLEALRGVAVDLFLMGDFNGALPYQEKVVAADLKDAQTRVELGFNYLNHQSQPEKAVAVLGEAVALDPSAKYLTFLGQAQDAVGRPADAEASYKRAISTDPTYARAYEVLIALLESQGRKAEADQVRTAAQKAGVNLSS